jgi:hypothetical protein
VLECPQHFAGRKCLFSILSREKLDILRRISKLVTIRGEAPLFTEDNR